MTKGERRVLLATFGLSLASLLGVFALTLRASADRGNWRAYHDLYEERLAHMSTRWGALDTRVGSLEFQVGDLWDHHKAAMQVDTRLVQSDSYQDNLLMEMDSAIRDLMQEVGRLQRTSQGETR